MTIHRRYRICRRHFDSDCLNGGCRRLLNTAVPTLHLEPIETESVRIDEAGNLTTEPNVVYLAVAQGDNENDEHLELIEPEEEKQIIDVQKVKSKCAIHFNCLLRIVKFRALIEFNIILVLNTNVVHTTVKRKSNEMQLSPNKLGGNKYGYLKEIHTKHKIKRQKLECDPPNGKCVL